jgi:hypothetical protein
MSAFWHSAGLSFGTPMPTRASTENKRPDQRASWELRCHLSIPPVRGPLPCLPHEMGGLRARLAARVALHNFCIWLNDHLGRPRLKFADLMGW